MFRIYFVYFYYKPLIILWFNLHLKNMYKSFNLHTQRLQLLFFEILITICLKKYYYQYYPYL